MTRRQRRFAWIGAGVVVLGVATALVLNAFQSNLVFFFSRAPDGLTVRFSVTDTMQTIPVVFTGILPDLFKEGKGVVAQGTLGADGVFRATEVLAKHDENYMPPEAAAALDQAKARTAMEKAAKTLQP